MEDYRKAYEEWLSNPYFDEATKAELKAIEHDDNEIKERFYTELEFELYHGAQAVYSYLISVE